MFIISIQTQTNKQMAFVLFQSLQPHFQTHSYAYYVIWSITRSYSNNCYQSLNLPYSIKRTWREISGGATGVFHVTSAYQNNFKRHWSQKWVLQLKQKDKKYIKSQLLAKQHTLCWSPTRNIHQKLRVKIIIQQIVLLKSVFIRV